MKKQFCSAVFRFERTSMVFHNSLKNKAVGPFFSTTAASKPLKPAPPVMQVLWHLGVPMVSSEYLLPLNGVGWRQFGEIRQRQRVEFQSLVLTRAAWELPQEVWVKLFQEGKSQAARIGSGTIALEEWGIPRRFFGQFTARREKPQFFDMDSPISMLLLEKNIRGGTGNLLLTEMLPMPEHWLGERAMEFVVEWERGLQPA